jgi:hypothetical protein
MATPVPSATIESARTYADDANVRSRAADYTVTTNEGIAYLALIAALKAAGVGSPFMAVLDNVSHLPGATASSFPNFRA